MINVRSIGYQSTRVPKLLQKVKVPYTSWIYPWDDITTTLYNIMRQTNEFSSRLELYQKIKNILLNRWNAINSQIVTLH